MQNGFGWCPSEKGDSKPGFWSYGTFFPMLIPVRDKYAPAGFVLFDQDGKSCLMPKTPTLDVSPETPFATKMRDAMREAVCGKPSNPFSGIDRSVASPEKMDDYYEKVSKASAQTQRTFRAGDIVRLKSGGPEMTVEGIVKEGDLFHTVGDERIGDIRVCWFHKSYCAAAVAVSKDDYGQEYGECDKDTISPAALVFIR